MKFNEAKNAVGFKGIIQRQSWVEKNMNIDIAIVNAGNKWIVIDRANNNHMYGGVWRPLVDEIEATDWIIIDKGELAGQCEIDNLDSALSNTVGNIVPEIIHDLRDKHLDEEYKKLSYPKRCGRVIGNVLRSMG